MQYLRIAWARKWTALLLFVVIATAGVAYTLSQPRQFVAETSLLVELRIDPALGALAPSLAAPSYIATQVEIIRSERVASRAVKILGVERSTGAVAQWREATGGKLPLERYFAGILQRGLSVEPAPGSNILNIGFSSADPAFAQAAANAFAQAYMDVSVDLRIAPARQSAAFLEDQAKTLRASLEQAQAKLSKFQQSKGIVVSDERLDQENARYNTLMGQLSAAQAEMLDTSSRQRGSGRDSSPDVLASGAVQGLKSQLTTAETKLTSISSIVGRNHPSRVQLEAEIAELKQQIGTETRRVAGGTGSTNREVFQRVSGLQAMVDVQKKQLLSLRSDRDQIAVYVRDVDASQRSYDAVVQRLGVINLEGQNNQANTRILSPAVEPLAPSRPRVIAGLLASILGALAFGLVAVFAIELLDRRVRAPEDLLVIAGVPVIGVLRTATSRRPVFRRMLMVSSIQPIRPALAGPGMRS